MNLQRDTSLTAALERLKTRSLHIRHVFSIGAGGGSDSVYMRNLLCPEARMLLIEAQSLHEPALAVASQKNEGVSYAICAAAEEDGEVSFAVSSPTGGAVTAKSADTVSLPARSLDSLAAEYGWDGPFMLKFDTHGVELEILAGAKETLKRTSLVMMEVYNFKLNFVDRKNLTFHEMCRWMEGEGLRCVDMCDPLFRPNDSALWQMHLFFMRNDHPVFASNSYNAPALQRT